MTTRIETMLLATATPVQLHITEQHPWQQGLKHYGGDKRSVWRHWLLSSIHDNKDWNAIEFYRLELLGEITEQHPWQQGLKLDDVKGVIDAITYYWAASMTTRIETNWYHTAMRLFGWLLSSIHDNKDWNKPKNTPNLNLNNITEQHPWQQGLKHSFETSLFVLKSHYWAASMTTRIETGYRNPQSYNLSALLSSIHDNKDWNLLLPVIQSSSC